jgi:tRNA A-37 threonylcarbamoyl transferase component Bud32
VTPTETTARPPQIPGYQYIADIATGGYSVVYRYRQRSPRRDVAVKVLTAFDAPVAPEQRDAEADMMAKLGNHPNIVQVIVADVAPDGRHYIIMPYYPGRSLAELVVEGQLAVGKVLRVGVQIAGALDAAHRLGLLHRDLKPGNILIDEYGMPRLTDFGIAGWVGPGSRTDSGGMSIPWSPAEVVAGGPSQRASDVYSLGATLFHLLTGQPPYARAVDTREALEARIQGTDAPATGRSDMPEAFERLLARMLSRAPERRPESASLVAAKLRDIEASLGGPAAADAPWHTSSTVSALPERFVKTVLRPTPLVPPTAPAAVAADVPAEPATETVPQPRGFGGARWILVMAATVAVAVIAAGIVWSAHGSPPPRPAPTTVGNQNAAIDEPPPGAVTIVGKRHGGKITFTWTYDGADATDTFLWRVTGAAKTTAATQPTAVVRDTTGGQVCIQVKVVRLDGSYSGDWSRQGCGS